MADLTIENLLSVVHSYTDPIRIKVIIGDAWITCDEAKHMSNFYLTKCYRNVDRDETERLLKYYKDCPVWNLVVWVDGPSSSPNGRQFVCGIEAHCHYKYIREGWLAEMSDRRRARRREYYKRKKEEQNETVR